MLNICGTKNGQEFDLAQVLTLSALCGKMAARSADKKWQWNFGNFWTDFASWVVKSYEIYFIDSCYIRPVFHTFHKCPIMSQLPFIYKTCLIYVGHKMVKSFTSHKSAHCQHCAVKWPHLVQQKNVYEILKIFEQILIYEWSNFYEI